MSRIHTELVIISSTSNSRTVSASSRCGNAVKNLIQSHIMNEINSLHRLTMVPFFWFRSACTRQRFVQQDNQERAPIKQFRVHLLHRKRAARHLDQRLPRLVPAASENINVVDQFRAYDSMPIVPHSMIASQSLCCVTASLTIVSTGDESTMLPGPRQMLQNIQTCNQPPRDTHGTVRQTRQRQELACRSQYSLLNMTSANGTLGVGRVLDVLDQTLCTHHVCTLLGDRHKG